MARTSTRRTKGCPMCKPWKFAGHGDSYRQPPRVQRQFGRTRRWNRHEIPSLHTARTNKSIQTARKCPGAMQRRKNVRELCKVRRRPPGRGWAPAPRGVIA
jgi:hypothetical protein